MSIPAWPGRSISHSMALSWRARGRGRSIAGSMRAISGSTTSRCWIAPRIAWSTRAASPAFTLNYVHTGMAGEEHFALDGVVLEGAWPGPLDRWLDESNLGKYYFQRLL